ncbi:MAG: hypothetical protein OEY64_12325 [Nitrospinota bacterium]|nr:hypothetical protein [Nitrospinota bacterium]
MHKKILLIVALVTTVASCMSSPLEKAFKPGMVETESNRVINEYCISCHTHSKFDGESHVFDVKYRYNEKEFAGQTGCRVCHSYEKTWLLDARRHTRRPVNQ